ncbi:hypothetical protein [Streptomyces sp. NPDC006552]|uniref:hypothetical protein n=1 Tax=Streptomyces sp. NPDC006552 TaxID=3157179 RepID=UPI0033BCF72E
MTVTPHTQGSLPVLALYPRRYRTAHGPEIQQMYHDATSEAGRATRLREQLDIAAHALRIRTRTGPGHPAGRFLLTAAPYALSAACATAATDLTAPATHALLTGATPGMPHPATAVHVLVLMAGAVACLGRWPLARMLGVVSLLPTVFGVGTSPWLIPLLVTVAAMPGAAVPARTERRLAAGFATLTWLPALAAALAGAADPSLGMIGRLCPTLLLLAVRSARPDARPRHVFAVLLAGAAWITTPAASTIGLAVVSVALTVAWAAGRLARMARTRRRATA